ncbi:hypothetical protein ACP4OV_026946 [Aristida adscensionis]
MEAIVSVAIGDLISRAFSFLIKQYTDRTAIDEKLERLQQLLLRIHTVVEEADGRYITNPRMLEQFKLLVMTMYQGYHMLDIFLYKSLLESSSDQESTPFFIPLKRSRIVHGAMRRFYMSSDLDSAVGNLESAISDLTEFVVLLGGCEHMCRRPYDAYLYTDNFMFGRHVEKQQMINILLQDHGSRGAPVVLPVIGGMRIGKKTLVSHVCNNYRIKAHFPSIMFINGDCISRIDHAKFSNQKTVVIVEFLTDVDDDDWAHFYSTVTFGVGEGSKVIIISRIPDLARFGTTQTIFLNSLSHEEYRYLFKMLAFGSTDGRDYPRLASIANELAVVLGGSLITANAVANLLRRNLDVQFWLKVLNRFKAMVENNLSKYGAHPKNILDDERRIDITQLCSSVPASLCLMPPRVERDDSPTRKLAHISMGDLITGCTPIPKDDFVLVAWESRIPPCTRTINLAAYVEEQHGCTASTRKRRSGI